MLVRGVKRTKAVIETTCHAVIIIFNLNKAPCSNHNF